MNLTSPLSGSAVAKATVASELFPHLKVLFVSRAEPHEVRSLCRRLSLAYMDMQANGLFGILFR